ncbi:MAG: hypothetical protein ACR2J5_01200 [Geodermatophilaceae bacterium]
MSVVGILVIVAFVALVVGWMVLTHRNPLYRRGQKVNQYGNQRTEDPDFFPGQGDAGGM